MQTRPLTLALLLPLLASCGADSPDKVRSDMIEQYTTISKLVDSVSAAATPEAAPKDVEAAAKDAAAKIVETQPKIAAIAARHKKLEKIANIPFGKAFPEVMPVLEEIRTKRDDLVKKDPVAGKIIDDAITQTIGQI